MKIKKIYISLIAVVSAATIISCSKDKPNNNIITIDLGSDIATLDPQKAEDVQSARVAYDLFEGLTSFDQSNKVVPGLAEKWNISEDGKIYTFILRDNLKFSDGTPITVDDVIFTYQRLANPKTASPYNFLIDNIVNGEQIIKGKLAHETLGIRALDNKTIQITLNNPDSSFLDMVGQPGLSIVSKANINKFGQAWIDPKNMVTSGAYKLTERVIQGHILTDKNTNYYAAKDIAINQVKFLPIVDYNSSFNQYEAGNIDITFRLPIDQYKNILKEYPKETYTVLGENIDYYDFNMTLPKFKDNAKLRQALSMAVDRNVLANDIMGLGQKPLYSVITSTVEEGKFAGIEYDWAKLPRSEQITQAKQLFKEAGYGPKKPLELKITYNTRDDNKKKAIAIGAMWENTFGKDSIKVTSNNQEWKTFLETRHKASYDIARDAWYADYNHVYNYTQLFTCNSPLNNAHECIKEYDDLIKQSKTTQNDADRVKLVRQALALKTNSYSIIPLYQDTYYRLVKPRVQGYIIQDNHLDHVMTKWFSLKN